MLLTENKDWLKTGLIADYINHILPRCFQDAFWYHKSLYSKEN